MKVKIFVAVSAIKNYQIILFDIISQIDENNKNNYEVVYVLYGDKNLYHHLTKRKDLNIKVINELNTRMYSSPGLVELYKDAISNENDDCDYYAFFHLKGAGVTRVTGKDKKRNERREGIDSLFKVLNDLENIEKKLDYFDVIGWRVNHLQLHPYEQRRYHASPNFWIAKRNHIKKLNIPTKENLIKDSKFLLEPGRASRGIGHYREDSWRYSCEMWIGFPQETVFYSLEKKDYFRSNTN